MMPVHTLTIPDYVPPSLNRLLRLHWAAANRMKRECYDLVAAYAKQQEIPPAIDKRRVSLAITLSGRKKPQDQDNCQKVILDALVKARMLIDDGPSFLAWGGVEWSRGEACETRVTLEDIEP